VKCEKRFCSVWDKSSLIINSKIGIRASGADCSDKDNGTEVGNAFSKILQTFI